MRDFRARLRYLDEVIPLLYPAAAPGPAARRASYAVVPSRLLPRRLVPRSRWLPGRRRLPAGAGTIEAYLSEVFGRRVRATAHIRPARRANRKPVLEVRGTDGGLLAFVKIGHTERSRALVRHEGATLDALAGTPLKIVTPPAVLHHGVWNELEVLALSPLPVPPVPLPVRLRLGRTSIPTSLLTRAVREIAALAPVAIPGTTASEDLLGDHLGRAALPVGAHAWPVTASRSADRHGAPPNTATASSWNHAWHGDFAPWNMAAAPDGRLLVWDWERFATGVPIGFDALHHSFQRALRRMPPPIAAQACLAQSARTLEPFAVPAHQARSTALHYLITLADRHEQDGHHPLGPPSEWLTPLADRQEALL
ncbi:hypothetical protein [Sphaerisporangium sp. TRM90804]|uniref:hypothetical protein n=1 Tax=Sphaerisporangium sp. TRM90804 TaxID=3031113 RepID=UPI00244C1EFC|nr:hypothetical protein [Sphaerisporangium sp. TRM90804]MDH2428754.1 hypothetical protein [Sphaerisporangium sp. TRM90804]